MAFFFQFAYQNRRMGACRFGKVSQRIHQRRCTKHAGASLSTFSHLTITHLKAIVQIAADTAVAAWIQGALVDVYLAQGAYFWAHTLSSLSVFWHAVYIRFGRRNQAVCVPNPRNYGNKISHLLRPCQTQGQGRLRSANRLNPSSGHFRPRY